MQTAELLKKMIEYSHGSLRDIAHFTAAWTYAKTIGELEELDAHTQFLAEAAAIVHDIACPLIRDSSGHADWKRQELEGPPLAEQFLSGCDVPAEDIARLCWLVGHHHTLGDIREADYQILIEADYIVNAMENRYPAEQIRTFLRDYVKTATGAELITSLFLTC